MDKIVPRETIDENEDITYEYSRAIKTFCIIMVVFCIGFILKRDYNNLLDNSRFLKFYPENTLYYEDFSDAKDFKKIKTSDNYSSLSYGIFKNERGIDKFLIVAKTEEENTPILDKRKYSYFIKDGYAFLSNDISELMNVQTRLSQHKYAFLKHKGIKKAISKLDKTRDYTIIIDNSSYANLKVTSDIEKAVDKVFDKAVIQVFNENNGLRFNGEITFENNLAGAAINIKKLSECFTNRNIKIGTFQKDNIALIVAVKDFDLWTQAMIDLSKNLPKNQYSETVSLIQNIFNSDVETDIVKKLNGNAVFYLFKEKRDLHPMLTIETKQDIESQVQKYFSFLQLSNSLQLSKKEINNQQLNILKGKVYPYNLSFGMLDNNLFLLGHQKIIENFIENSKSEVIEKDSDFYFFANINKTPALKKNKGFWNGYKTLEVNLFLKPHITFNGTMTK